MSRLFVGNFSFEQARDAARNPTRQVLRFEAELACVWLAVAEEGDEIYCPVPINEDYWARMRELGLPAVRPLSPDDLSSSRAREIVPWGWTPGILQLAKRLNIPVQAPAQEVVWRINSREFAWEMCTRLGCTIPGEGIARTLDDVLTLTSEILRNSQSWIIKPNHGQAGRGHLRSEKMPSEKELKTISRLLQRQKAVHIEPFLAKEVEIGSQWEIPRDGPPRHLGITELFTDSHGGYCGSGLPQKGNRFAAMMSEFEDDLFGFQKKIVEELQTRGYVGPVGIDAMIYRTEHGQLVRPVQDINARWTMGRLAWEWGRRWERITENAGNAGCWWHSEESPTTSAIALSPTQLAPTQLEGTAVRHRTWWINTPQ